MERLRLRGSASCLCHGADHAPGTLLHENVPRGHADKDCPDQRHLQEITPYVQRSKERVDGRRDC